MTRFDSFVIRPGAGSVLEISNRSLQFFVTLLSATGQPLIRKAMAFGFGRTSLAGGGPTGVWFWRPCLSSFLAASRDQPRLPSRHAYRRAPVRDPWDCRRFRTSGGYGLCSSIFAWALAASAALFENEPVDIDLISFSWIGIARGGTVIGCRRARGQTPPWLSRCCQREATIGGSRSRGQF